MLEFNLQLLSHIIKLSTAYPSKNSTFRLPVFLYAKYYMFEIIIGKRFFF